MPSGPARFTNSFADPAASISCTIPYSCELETAEIKEIRTACIGSGRSLPNTALETSSQHMHGQSWQRR